MTDETLNHIRDWFEAYAQQFMAAAPTAESRRAMMRLKLAHSRRVAAEARSLATELGWDNGDQNTAEALGWLRDTGRFSQMAEFGTFRDAQSVNHALRGHQVLSQVGILRQCSAKRARQILDSVLHHNVLRVPDDVHPDSVAFVRLIRSLNDWKLVQVSWVYDLFYVPACHRVCARAP